MNTAEYAARLGRLSIVKAAFGHYSRCLMFFFLERSTGASPALGSFCGREEQSGEPHNSFTPQQCGDGHLLLVV